MNFTDSVSDERLIEIINKSDSFQQILEHFGVAIHGGNYKTIHRKMKELGIDNDRFYENVKKRMKNIRNRQEWAPEDVFIKNSPYKGTGGLKQKLFKYGLLENKCSICGMLPEWMGFKLVLILDHINGIRSDNRIENLRIVCPNCNSQLETFCGANIKTKNRCSDCGRHVQHKGKRCLKCHATHQYKTTKRKVKNRPTKEALMLEVSESTYKAVGKKYGVSDNTIIKWIKLYNKHGEYGVDG